jgi:hypothetical protein
MDRRKGHDGVFGSEIGVTPIYLPLAVVSPLYGVMAYIGYDKTSVPLTLNGEP